MTQQAAIKKRPTTTVSLQCLELHPNNVRRAAPAGIAELADSIARDGLLNPLTVCSHPTEAQIMLVPAGGRRLAALQLLAKQKRIPEDYGVPVTVVQPEEAEIISLTENQMREQMHPIDQFLAFKAQVDAGQPIPDVAARFGVTETFVKQRLKLASVSPKLIDVYRVGKMTLEQLQAFSVNDNHTRQEEVWKEIKSSRWDDDPDDIKRELFNDQTGADDTRLKFVGLKAYQKAGGAVIEADLFAEKGDETKTLSDPDLLERLALEKLQKRAAKLQKDEGLAWCEAMTDFNFYDGKFSRVPTSHREMTKAEAKQYNDIEKKLEAKQKELDTCQDADDVDDALEDRLIDEINALEGQRDAIDEACLVPHPDAQEYIGAVVSLTLNGQVGIERNLIRKDDLKKLKPMEKPVQNSGTTNDEQPPEPTAGHSEKLVKKLLAHKTAILRNQIAKTKSGLGIMVYHMLIDIDEGMHFEDDLNMMGFGGPLLLNTRTIGLHEADDIEDSKAVLELKQQESKLLEPIRKHLKSVKSTSPGDRPRALYNFIMDAPMDYQLELLSFLVATQMYSGKRDMEIIEQDFMSDAETADYWKPTRASYFDQVPKAQIVAAVTEKYGEERGAHLAKLTKSEAADRAEDELKDSKWLPAPMKVTPKAPPAKSTKPKKAAAA